MLPPNEAWPGSRGPFKFWQNSGNISKTVQDSDMVTMGNYQVVPFRMTFEWSWRWLLLYEAFL